MVHLVIEARRSAWPARVVRRRAAEFLRRLRDSREVTILLTTDRRLRELNRRFRGKDLPTDVLSFPGEGRHLGDLAISLDTARRQARALGNPLSVELSLYVAHGLLHLRGLDHERSAGEARAMAGEEARLLGAAGMLDRSHAGGPGEPEVESGDTRPRPRGRSRDERRVPGRLRRRGGVAGRRVVRP